jgi:hypothetical protein
MIRIRRYRTSNGLEHSHKVNSVSDSFGKLPKKNNFRDIMRLVQLMKKLLEGLTIIFADIVRVDV